MRRRGRSATLALALVGTPALGCYNYATPLTDRPVPETVVEVVLNDRGRVAMEGNVGPEIMSIEGVVSSATDSLLMLSVTKVTGLSRDVSRWNGETVTIRTEHVRQLRERRFSMARTVLLVGSATATAALAVSGALTGFGGSPSGPSQPPPPGSID